MENMGTASAEIEIVDVASIEAQNPSSEVETEVPVGTEISHDELVRDISVRLRDLTRPPSSRNCIYRVPEKIRKLDEDAYTPHVVSIGPYHHGIKNFQSMEKCKWRYFKAFIQQSGVSLKSYVELMKDSEGRARANYADTIEMTSDEFVTMILVDGCFILKLVELSYNIGACRWVTEKVDTFIFYNKWLFTRIFHDLILLENQIPFFILESIYHLAFPNGDSNDQLHKYILQFFKSQNNQNKSPDFREMMHFTDLIRELYRRSSEISQNRPSHRNSEIKLVHTATQLHKVGLIFRKGSSKCLLDVKFTCGVLKFPLLTLQDETKFIFQNLMALEVCHYSEDTPIIDYVVFLGTIIHTPNDVDLLVERGILYNGVGSTSAAADIVNNLGKEFTYSSTNSYLIPLYKDLNAYYNRQTSTLKRIFCRTPSLTVVIAVTLLLLTIIQIRFHGNFS